MGIMRERELSARATDMILYNLALEMLPKHFAHGGHDVYKSMWSLLFCYLAIQPLHDAKYLWFAMQQGKYPGSLTHMTRCNYSLLLKSSQALE